MKPALAIRIWELDGLRGVAVLGVLLWHFVGSMAPPGDSIASEILRSATVFGRTGVDLFFVLSGFLIIGILIDFREAPNLFRVFYVRRFLRIFPPYLILLAMYWIIYLALGESAAFNTRYGFWVQFLAQITFTFNLLMAWADGAVARGLSVVWSVSIEEWFYLIVPLFIVRARGSWLFKLIMIIGLSSALARAAFHLAYPSLWQAPYVLPPFRLDGLCFGGLVAIMVRDNSTMNFLVKHQQSIGRFAIFNLGLAVLLIIAVRKNLDSNMYIWGHLYLSFTYALAITAVVLFRGSKEARFLNQPALLEAGRYSYSLYLFHPLFISLYFQLAGRPESVSSIFDVAICVVSLFSAVALSVFSYWWMERKLIQLGHSYQYDIGGRQRVNPP